jgi:hypothetical protein
MPPLDHATVTTNGSTPEAATSARDASLAALRTRPENVHLFRGYGPLVVGAILFLLMVVLAPSVAPERVVERPVDQPAAEAPAGEATP